MRKIRIAHLLGGGILCGAGQYAMKLIEGLEGDRFSFSLISLKDGPLAAEAERRGIRVHVLGKKRTADPLAIFNVARVLRSERADLIHTHTSNSNLYGILGSLFSSNCRAIVTLHAYYKDVNRAYVPKAAFLQLGYQLDLLLLRRASHIITVSRSIRDRVIADGFRPTQLTVIPNGIDLRSYRDRAEPESVRKEFGIGKKDVLIGTAGRLSAEKNHALFVNAAARIVPKMSHLKFIVFGDGPEEDRLKHLATQTGCASHVIFAGWRNDIARCLSALDIFVLSSRSEVAPFALLESMALEIPVVSTRVGGVQEMVEHGYNGLLTENDNVGQMVDAITRLASDPAYRKELGAHGRLFVEQHFSEEVMLRSTSDIYSSVFKSTLRAS